MADFLYDTLAKFESLYRTGSYPVHKKLSFGLESGIKDLDDWLCNYVQLDTQSKILDAGCGNGNSLFKLVEKFSCSGMGISLSKVEIQKAVSHSRKKLLMQNCRFEVHDFENPIPQKFNLIYAIESIKHCHNINTVIGNFANQLEQNAILIIVEDLKITEISNKEYLNFHEKTWISKTLSEKEITGHAVDNNLKLIDSIDFTNKMSKLTLKNISYRIKKLNLLRKIIPFKKYRKLIDVFIAGFMLDYFYASDEMKYKALIFEKTS